MTPGDEDVRIATIAALLAVVIVLAIEVFAVVKLPDAARQGHDEPTSIWNLVFDQMR